MTNQEIINELKKFGITFSNNMVDWLEKNHIPFDRGGELMIQVWQDGLNSCKVALKIIAKK